MNRFLTSIVAWLRAGYPEGIPPTDYFPVLALLSRRLSNDEVKAVAHELMQRDDFDDVDIGVLITQLTDELPSPADVERVRERLAAKGWPLDDARDGEERRIAVLRAFAVDPGVLGGPLLAALEQVLQRPGIRAAAGAGRCRSLRVVGVAGGRAYRRRRRLVVTTSGTTGAPKGALLTAAALTASA